MLGKLERVLKQINQDLLCAVLVYHHQAIGVLVGLQHDGNSSQLRLHFEQLAAVLDDFRDDSRWSELRLKLASLQQRSVQTALHLIQQDLRRVANNVQIIRVGAVLLLVFLH